ncbi:hypothetical protein Goari_006782, partial [Gossypium aridum]|nr:hypothetical protein [Gossypium aridum]
MTRCLFSLIVLRQLWLYRSFH